MQIRFAMNMLSLLQQPKVKNNLNCAELPLASHIFPPDQYTREEEDGHSLLRFKDQTTGKSFFLEIKTCTCDWMHHIQWCTELQLRKYLSYHKKTPTFLLLDVQNDNNNSHSYYLLSMTQACHVNLIDTSIMHCKIDTNAPVLSKQLWSR
jgi:hypothetical protein